MALAALHTFSPGEILTAANLNAEFANIRNNPISLVSPTTGNIDFALNQALDFGLEKLSAAPAAATAGRIYYNTARAQIELDDATAIRCVPSVISTNVGLGSLTVGTTSNNFGLLSAGSTGQWPLVTTSGGLAFASTMKTQISLNKGANVDTSNTFTPGGDGNYYNVSSSSSASSTMTAIAAQPAGTEITLLFNSTHLLVHSSSLFLVGRNVLLTSGSMVSFIADTTQGDWRMTRCIAPAPYPYSTGVTIQNTAVETTVFSATVPAGVITSAKNGLVELLGTKQVNSSGTATSTADTLTYRLYVNGVSVWATSGVFAFQGFEFNGTTSGSEPILRTIRLHPMGTSQAGCFMDGTNWQSGIATANVTKSPVTFNVDTSIVLTAQWSSASANDVLTFGRIQGNFQGIEVGDLL